MAWQTLGDSRYLLRDLRRDDGVRALDLVVDRLADVVQEAARRAVFWLAPSSAAMIAARWAHSTEWLSTFWP